MREICMFCHHGDLEHRLTGARALGSLRSCPGDVNRLFVVWHQPAAASVTDPHSKEAFGISLFLCLSFFLWQLNSVQKSSKNRPGWRPTCWLTRSLDDDDRSKMMTGKSQFKEREREREETHGICRCSSLTLWYVVTYWTCPFGTV